MSNIPGDEIIKEILNGNEKILKKVYKKVFNDISRFARGIKASDAATKEAVQDAFEIFYRQALKGTLNLNCTLETYIISIAKRVILKGERDWSHRIKDGFETDDEIYSDEVGKKTIQEQQHQLFKEEFDKLNSECKTILSLTLEGYSYSEIKNILKLSSEELIRKKRSRCKKYLIDRIKENPDYEKLRNAQPEDYEFSLWENE